MKTARWTLMILVGCSAWPLLCSAQAILQTPSGPISMELIQQDFDAQKYTDVIRKTTMAIQYKGPSAAQLDKPKLYAIKAEAQLRLKQFGPAAETFTLAAKEATDEKDIALNKATALLIRKSPAGQYTPRSASSTQPAGARGPKAPPIAIVDPESRTKAMAALLEDELKVLTPKLQAAIKQPALPPVMNAINDVHELRMIELAATGQDSSCAQLFASLENRAGQLMGDALKTMSQKVEKISKAANDGSTYNQESPYGGRRTVTSKAGLNSNDKDTLNDVIDTSKKIVAACEEFAKVLPVGKGDGALARVDIDASKLADRADEVLHANYDPDVVDAPGGQIVMPPQVAPQVPGSRVVPTPRTGNR